MPPTYVWRQYKPSHYKTYKIVSFSHASRNEREASCIKMVTVFNSFLLLSRSFYCFLFIFIIFGPFFNLYLFIHQYLTACEKRIEWNMDTLLLGASFFCLDQIADNDDGNFGKENRNIFWMLKSIYCKACWNRKMGQYLKGILNLTNLV